MEIFTIGHSNHELEKFLQLLKTNSVEALVDIRSNPYSRFASQSNKDNLASGIVLFACPLITEKITVKGPVRNPSH